MNSEKYIGLDVHQATISAAVLDETGKLIIECILETKAATILEFFAGLSGTLAITFEEGTSAGWLYDLLTIRIERRPPIGVARHSAAVGDSSRRGSLAISKSCKHDPERPLQRKNTLKIQKRLAGEVQ